MQQLEAMGTAQNRKIYKRHGAGDVMYGVSFANLKLLKRKLVSPEGKKGVNHALSLELWETGNSDARTFAILIAEPAKLSQSTLEVWVHSIQYYLLADMLGNVVGQSILAIPMMKRWIDSEKEYIKRTGYAVLNYLAREDKLLDDAFFEPYIALIADEIQSSDNRAKEGMNNCVIAIGGRSEALRDKVIEAAKRIGKVEIDHGETSCKTFIIEDYVAKIWARKMK